MKNVSKIAVIVIVSIVFGLALLAATTSTVEATTEAGCGTWRSYGFVSTGSEPASAGVVGHVLQFDTDQGSQSWTMTITEKQARYMRESVAGGCDLWINFVTRGTTGTLGMGEAEFSGTVTVQGAAGGSVSESGAHPLGVCPNTLICLEEIEHWLGLGELEAGEVITITAEGTATAIAGGYTTLDQATAGWRVRYPALQIPIP